MRATISYQTSPPSFSPAKLSQREREVLTLVIEGQSNVEIAAAFYLSPNAVKTTHVSDILNKFGVNRRIQAAVFALRHGFV